MPHTSDKSHSIELRFYRYAMIILMGMLTAIAGYIATATINTGAELPAIKQELASLNYNLGKLENLPLQVQANKDDINAMDKRVAWLEKSR